MSRIVTTKTPRISKSKKSGTENRKQIHDSRCIQFGSLDHILLVLETLDDVYHFGDLPAEEFATGEPLDGLILTLLSQNTNDRNRDMAYENLRSKYPTWHEVAALPGDRIALLIRSAGLGETKAVRMKQILGIIHDDFGDYTLVPMMEWDPGDVRTYLSSLPGIGPKTVGCVMAFDLDMPAFPVDTHVARISKRLGWAGEKQSPEKIQDFLESTVPPEKCRGGHLDMIEHGRKVCHARRPDCTHCVVQTMCRYIMPGFSEICI